MKRKYELTLTKNYVADWNTENAVAEFIQNGIDQSVNIANNELSIEYTKETETLIIANKASVLAKKTLLLGCTSKADDDTAIGNFGEGYKVALLVLNRLGKKVTIFNYGEKEVWTSRFVKSRKYEGEEVLTVFVETEYPWKKVPNNNLTVQIEGITEEEFEIIQERTLLLQKDFIVKKAEPYGAILKSECHKGKIFVNGLYVTSIEEIDYGYDVKPAYLKIGRDRNLLNDFDILKVVGAMYSKLEVQEVMPLLKNESKDVSMINSIVESTSEDCMRVSEFSEKIYKEFIDENGENAVPVYYSSEKEELENFYEDIKTVEVTSVLKKVIDGSGCIDFNKFKKRDLSPFEEFKSWKERYEYEVLNRTKIEELDDIVKRLLQSKENRIDENEDFFETSSF